MSKKNIRSIIQDIIVYCINVKLEGFLPPVLEDISYVTLSALWVLLTSLNNLMRWLCPLSNTWILLYLRNIRGHTY